MSARRRSDEGGEEHGAGSRCPRRDDADPGCPWTAAESPASWARRGEQTPVLPAPSDEQGLALSHLDAWSADRIRRSSLPPSTPAATPVQGPLSPLPPRGRADLLTDDAQDDLLRLVDQAPSSPAFDLVSEMTDRFALGDFSGALRAAELLLGRDGAHALAQHYARESREKLDLLYTSKLGRHGGVPQVAVAASELRWLGFDSKAGTLLTYVDGALDYEEVIARCGLPRLEALKALVELAEAEVIRLV